jgi:hypothetical protein
VRVQQRTIELPVRILENTEVGDLARESPRSVLVVILCDPEQDAEAAADLAGSPPSTSTRASLTRWTTALVITTS